MKSDHLKCTIRKRAIAINPPERANFIFVEFSGESVVRHDGRPIQHAPMRELGTGSERERFEV
jgi:hypothetical protein